MRTRGRSGWRWRRVSSGVRAAPKAVARPAIALLKTDLGARQSADPRAHAQPGGADPATRRPYHRRRRQAAAADADPRLRPAVRLSRRRAISRSPPRSNSSTPPPCCTTMSSTAATCAAAATPPTRSGATSRRCWSAISCSAASFELMVEDGSLRVLRNPLACLGDHRRGRGHQLITANDIATAEADYLDIIPPRPRPCSPPPAASAPCVAERPRTTRRRSTLRPQSRHRLPADRRRARLFGAPDRARQNSSATISATAR